MPEETLSLIDILKYVWVGVLVPILVFLFKRIDKLRDEVYTKVETKEYINDQLNPILIALDRHKEDRVENTEAMKDLNASVVDLKIAIAKITGAM